MQIPRRMRRRFHYLMVGVYLFVAIVFAIDVARDVVSGKPAWSDLWEAAFVLGSLSGAQQSLEWARSLKAEDEGHIGG